MFQHIAFHEHDVSLWIFTWYHSAYQNGILMYIQINVLSIKLKETVVYIQKIVLSIKFKKNENVKVCRGLEMKVLGVHMFN